jgi:hypothetical protein
MEIHVLRESFVDRLRNSIRDNVRKYKYDESWVEEFANGGSWEFNSHLKPEEELKLLNPSNNDLKDLENSIRLYKALSFLTPVQARDPRLWTRLAHVEFWPYMRKRWEVERYGSDIPKVERFILSRYFVGQNQSRSLLRNGIARLWWYGRITHDPDRKNPFELTGVLLDQLDITQQILERNLGRSRHVTTGFLEFLSRHRNELLGSGDGKRAKVRHLAKQLNLYGGITLLDCLGQTEIIAFLEDEFERLTNDPSALEAA